MPPYNQITVCQAPASFNNGQGAIPAIIRCYDSNGDADPFEIESPGMDVIEYSVPMYKTDDSGNEVVELEVLGVIMDLNYDGIADVVFFRVQTEMGSRVFRKLDIRSLNKRMKAFNLTIFNASDYFINSKVIEFD